MFIAKYGWKQEKQLMEHDYCHQVTEIDLNISVTGEANHRTNLHFPDVFEFRLGGPQAQIRCGVCLLAGQVSLLSILISSPKLVLSPSACPKG